MIGGLLVLGAMAVWWPRVASAAAAGDDRTTSAEAQAAREVARAAAETPIVVAIDPGHGGTNLGAVGALPGIYEKNVTLALARRVSQLLEAPRPLAALQPATGHGAAATAPAAPTPPSATETAQPIAVVLCRADDGLVPIRSRARCARDSGARLFLSLHANAVPAGVPRGAQHGFDVFVLGPREIEDDATLASLAEPRDADAAWAAHEVRAAAERSLALARITSDELSRVLGAAENRGIRQ